MTKTSDFEEKLTTQAFIKIIWDGSQTIYTWHEVRSKAEMNNIPVKEAKQHLANAEEKGIIEKHESKFQRTEYILLKKLKGAPPQPVTMKRETKLLRIWMHREFEWINRKEIIEEAKKRNIKERTTAYYLTKLLKLGVLEKRTTTGKIKNTFYRPNGYLYIFSKAAPIMVIEKSHNTITIPTGPYFWFTLHNFPTLNMLKPEFGEQLKEGLDHLTRGFNIIDHIRVEYVKEIDQRLYKHKKAGDLTEIDKLEQNEIYDNYMSAPFFMTCHSLSNLTSRMEYPYIKDHAYTLLHFIWMYLRVKSDLWDGALWNFGDGLSEEEIEEMLKDEFSESLVKKALSLFRTCLLKMWTIEVEELKKEIELLEGITQLIEKNNQDKSNLIKSDIEIYIRKLQEIKNFPKGYRAWGRFKRNERFDIVINELQNAISVSTSSSSLVKLVNKRLIEPTVKERKGFEDGIDDIKKYKDNNRDLERLIYNYKWVISPPLKNLIEWGILSR